ncbi:endoproteinase ArgC [Oryzisolibacter sp. LB2S]|uniref:trypsin-like serine peptidase n=1 Tax=Alicycliphilus soli TaxID=3228789 RepID=UPI00345839F8
MSNDHMRIGRAGACTLPLALLLVACGGGGGGGDTAGGGDAITPVWSERIEPYEPKAAPAMPQASGALARAPAGAAAVIALGPLPSGQRMAAAPVDAGAPRQIGQARALPETASVAATSALLHWQTTARGTQVAALRFAAQGARGLRLGVLVQGLPPGALLRFVGAADAVHEVDAQQLQALAARNASAGVSDEIARTYWGPDSRSDEATLEVEIPAGAHPAAVRLAVPRLAHLFMTAAEAENAVITKAAAVGCQVDVSCHPDYLEQSRSVARMTYKAEDDKFYFCTGTLLNDMASSGTPYFLSAQHCIPSQAVASTLETEWLYRSESCGSAAASPARRTLVGGATLLYASADTDTAFMRLNATVPASVIYAGSYYGGVPVGQALAGLHHADGEPLKLSLGTLLGYSSCTESSCSASGIAGNFLRVDWQQGSTELGSSGSGIFVTIGATRYLAGQLHGGNARCDRPDGLDFYGRFDRSYRAALRQWLNP